MENHIRYTHKYFLEIFDIVVGIRAVSSCAVRRRSGNAAAENRAQHNERHSCRKMIFFINLLTFFHSQPQRCRAPQ